MNRDTIFQAASLSKPVTALAILRLVSEGRLDLDADVRRYMTLPLDRAPHLSPVTPALDRWSPPVLLLQHRGGVIGRGTTPAPSFDRFLDAERGGGSRRLKNRRGTTVPSLSESWYGAGAMAAVSLTYPPGQRFSYSGAGYLVLQHVVEEITGQPFADHLERVLPDAGARVASFRLHPASTANFARGHDEHGRTLPGGYELVPWSAAAGLYTTATDMAEILATIVRGGNRFVDESLLEQMTSQGLGVFTRREAGASVIRHGGDNGGYRAAIFGVPSTASGVVVLTNGRSNRGAMFRRDLVDLLRR